jgi:hypothetical protein
MRRVYWDGPKEICCARFTPRRERQRKSFCERREGIKDGKLFHREKPPALERHIFDTSDLARANYRFVMIGKHFLSQQYTKRLNKLATLCKIIKALAHPRHYQLVASF